MSDMLKLILFSIILFCSECAKRTQNGQVIGDSLLESKMQILFREREYFKLRLYLEKYKNKISPDKWQYFRPFVESAFHHYPESIRHIDSLLKTPGSFRDDTAQVNLMLLLRDNYFKTFQYKKAAETGRELAGKYKNILGDRLPEVENTLIIHESLTSIPPQHIDLKKATLHWKFNRMGLIEIPIRRVASDFPMVIDTRAHISTVTESFAQKLGLRILDVSYEESSGITGNKFQSGLGIADSLYIGDILVQHVVFQVLPDKALYFPSIDFILQGILGFQVITQLKEIHIHRNGDLIISPITTKSSLNNLAFDGSTTVLSVRTGEDTLSFHFDTGAITSEFYRSYYNRYNSFVLKHGKIMRIESEGAGGTTTAEVYLLPVVDLIIGNKPIMLKDVAVRTMPTIKGQKYYGNLGQDVIKQFDEMILNFESMYIDFK
jgi:hypothetical protein